MNHPHLHIIAGVFSIIICALLTRVLNYFPRQLPRDSAKDRGDVSIHGVLAKPVSECLLLNSVWYYDQKLSLRSCRYTHLLPYPRECRAIPKPALRIYLANQNGRMLQSGQARGTNLCMGWLRRRHPLRRKDSCPLRSAPYSPGSYSCLTIFLCCFSGRRVQSEPVARYR